MKKIALTQGFVALIDDEDFELVSRHRWHADKDHRNIYAITTVRKTDGRRTTIMMHRLIMGMMVGIAVDHIDGNGLNNSKANLRIATTSENAMNRRPRKDSISGLKGVSWCKARRSWQASIAVDKKRIHLGFYYTAIDAHAAYCAASVRYHGEFGRTA